MNRRTSNDILARFRHDDRLPPDNGMNQSEQLLAPSLAIPDDRPIRVDMPHSPKQRRALSRMYNSLGVENYDCYMSDINFRNGGAAISLTNAAINSTPLVLPAGTKLYDVNKWPDAVQVYYLIRFFSIMPNATGAAGDIQCYFVSATGGSEVSLGDYAAATGGYLPVYSICPDAVTDPGNPNVGTLYFNWLGGSGAKSFGFTLGLSLMYLLPSRAENESELQGFINGRR